MRWVVAATLGCVGVFGCSVRSLGQGAGEDEASGEGESSGAMEDGPDGEVSGGGDGDTEGEVGGGVDGGAAVCGDGQIDGDEQCDDGNTQDGDDCTADCRLPGTRQWTVEITEIFDRYAHDVAVDAMGNAIIVGNVEPSGDGGEWNMWVNKYSPDGDELWAVEREAPQSEVAASVAVVGPNIVVVGEIKDSPLVPSTNAGRVWAYDADGNELWDDTVDHGLGAHGRAVAAFDDAFFIAVFDDDDDGATSVLVELYDTFGYVAVDGTYTSTDGLRAAAAATHDDHFAIAGSESRLACQRRVCMTRRANRWQTSVSPCAGPCSSDRSLWTCTRKGFAGCRRNGGRPRPRNRARSRRRS